MSDQLAFLQMIAEHPDDDVPRLVYADWLEETGEETHIARAEFIRLQCHLEQLRKLPGEEVGQYANSKERRQELLDRYAEMWKRQQELMDQYVESWLGALGEIYNPLSFVIKRGFLSEMEIASGTFLRHAQAIETLYPMIPKIELTVSQGHWVHLATCPALQFVPEVIIRGQYSPVVRWEGLDSLDEFLQSPYLSSMNSLDLGGCDLSLSSLTILGQGRTTPLLKKLWLPIANIPQYAIVEFLSSPLIGQLKYLHLYAPDTYTQIFTALLHSKQLTQLQNLYIHGCRLTLPLHEELREKYGEVLVIG